MGQGEAGGCTKAPTTINAKRPIKCTHKTHNLTGERRKNTFSQRVGNWLTSREDPQKAEQINGWTATFLDPSHCRRAQQAQPPPFSPQKPGRAGRRRRTASLGPRVRPALCLTAASAESPKLPSSSRSNGSRAGWRRFWWLGRGRWPARRAEDARPSVCIQQAQLAGLGPRTGLGLPQS